MAKGYIARDLHEQVHDELDHNRKLLPLQAATNRRAGRRCAAARCRRSAANSPTCRRA